MSENEFESVSLKHDVAKQIELICNDAKQYGIFVDKSSLLRAMIFNPIIVEYAIKLIINDKKNGKTETT